MFARLRLAFAFLTILPVRHGDRLAPEDLAGSAAHFPLVGWLLGGLLAGAAWLLGLADAPPSIAAVLLVSLSVWLTRGLHLDGLADLLDGLGGGQEPARRLAIMKDSAIGAFGVIGLVLLLLAKAAALTTLLGAGPVAGLPAVAAAPAAARWAMASLACGSSYPRLAGTGHAFVGKVKGATVAVAALWLLPLAALGWPGLAILAGALLPALWLRGRARHALGGVTGDVLGAACELGEACGWLAAALWAGLPL